MNPYESFTTGIQVVGSTKNLDTVLHGHFSTAKKSLFSSLVRGIILLWPMLNWLHWVSQVSENLRIFSMWAHQTYEDTVAPNPDWSLSHQPDISGLTCGHLWTSLAYVSAALQKHIQPHTHPKFDFHIKLPQNEALPEAPDSHGKKQHEFYSSMFSMAKR